jgi:hypothetical protein
MLFPIGLAVCSEFEHGTFTGGRRESGFFVGLDELENYRSYYHFDLTITSILLSLMQKLRITARTGYAPFGRSGLRHMLRFRSVRRVRAGRYGKRAKNAYLTNLVK